MHKLFILVLSVILFGTGCVTKNASAPNITNTVTTTPSKPKTTSDPTPFLCPSLRTITSICHNEMPLTALQPYYSADIRKEPTKSDLGGITIEMPPGYRLWSKCVYSPPDDFEPKHEAFDRLEITIDEYESVERGRQETLFDEPLPIFQNKIIGRNEIGDESVRFLWLNATVPALKFRSGSRFVLIEGHACKFEELLELGKLFLQS